GPFYGLANESMLKIKEMSLSTSEAYHSLEFRHGPKSMVDEDMLVTFFLSNSAFDTESKLVKEVKELGGRTLTVCEQATPAVKEYSDYLVELQSGLSDYARLILYMPVTQLLGYHAAVAKNLNPDQPTNLTQVVTL
ncbi:MAG TPA: SIS domain-containing protein, partial [bacterium]|nr:SIS domain-containing protein [bacterium]